MVAAAARCAPAPTTARGRGRSRTFTASTNTTSLRTTRGWRCRRTSSQDAAPGHANRRPRGGDAQEHFRAPRRRHDAAILRRSGLPQAAPAVCLPGVFPRSVPGVVDIAAGERVRARRDAGHRVADVRRDAQLRRHREAARDGPAEHDAARRRGEGAAPCLLFRRQLHRSQHRHRPQHARRRRNARVDDRRVLGRSRVAAGRARLVG